MYLPYKCHTCSGFVTPWLSSSITSLLTKTPWGWGSRIVAQRFPKAMPSILHPFKKISGNAFLRPKFRCGKLLQKGVGPATLVAGFILNLAWVTYPNLRVCDDESILTWTIGIAAKLSTATNICLRGTYFLLRSSEPILYLDVSKTKGLRVEEEVGENNWRLWHLLLFMVGDDSQSASSTPDEHESKSKSIQWPPMDIKSRVLLELYPFIICTSKKWRSSKDIVISFCLETVRWNGEARKKV